MPFKKHLFYSFIFGILFSIIICLGAIAEKGITLPFYKYLIIVIAFAVFIAIVGGIAGYYQEKYNVKRRKRLLQQSPFIQLLNNGFKLQEDAVIGLRQGYTVIVSFESLPASHIEIKIIFDAHQDNIYLCKDPEKTYAINKDKRLKKRLLSWGKCFMMYSIPEFFKIPNYEKIVEIINVMIGVLKQCDLDPADLEFYIKKVIK